MIPVHCKKKMNTDQNSTITLLRSQYISVQDKIQRNCQESVRLVKELQSIHHQILEQHMRSKRDQGLQQIEEQKRLEAIIRKLT